MLYRIATLYCFALAALPLHADYVVTDLGTLGGGDAQARAINNVGKAVGTSRNANN